MLTAHIKYNLYKDPQVHLLQFQVSQVKKERLRGAAVEDLHVNLL